MRYIIQHAITKNFIDEIITVLEGRHSKDTVIIIYARGRDVTLLYVLYCIK